MTSLLDIFDGDPTPSQPKPAGAEPGASPVVPTSGHVFGHGLGDDLRDAARSAADAADAESAAKAALDLRRGELQAKMDVELTWLKEAHKAAATTLHEAEGRLKTLMEVEKISRIPMDDRPDIRLKVVPGTKRDITKTWLSEPEGVVVKTYGPDAPKVIWDAVPRSDPRTDVIIPARYEDEPSR